MDILIATSNPGKFLEIESSLADLPQHIQWYSLKDFQIQDKAPEESGSYEDVALEKARFYFEHVKIPTICDDSGIEVDALPGELGLKTRRWGAGEKASDREWIEYFFDRIKDVPDGQRGATFVACVGLVLPNGVEKVFRGETRGVLTRELKAPIVRGVPLSSCFIPDGYDRVYSALETQQKNLVSHRGKAVSQLKDFLSTLLLDFF